MTFNKPPIKALAAEHNVSAAQLIMRWNFQLGVASNPLATNPAYQKENIDIFGFELSGADMACLGSLNASLCPVPPPTNWSAPRTCTACNPANPAIKELPTTRQFYI